MSTSWSCPLWTITIKLKTHNFESISLQWPTFSAKARNMFFFTSPKAFSLWDLIQCQGTEARFSFITSPPVNQKKVVHNGALPSNLLLKTLPWNPSKGLGSLNKNNLFSLPCPAMNISPLQSPKFLFVWPYCTSSIQTWIWQQKQRAFKLLFCIIQQARGTRGGTETSNTYSNESIFLSFRTESIKQTSGSRIHTILVHTFKLCEKFSNSDISPKNLNFIPLCWFKNSIGSKIWWNLKLAPEHGGQRGMEERGWSFQTAGR